MESAVEKRIDIIHKKADSGFSDVILFLLNGQENGSSGSVATRDCRTVRLFIVTLRQVELLALFSVSRAPKCGAED
jgi:hypothetical protein